MTGSTLQLIRWLTGQKPETVWDVKRHSNKRTLSQNAYYWQLVGQMADAVRLPKEQVHNELLRSYGQVKGIAGRLVAVSIPDTEKGWNEAVRMMTVHVKPTSQVKLGTKNMMFRTYVLIKGSSEMTTEEMSILLDGAVHEAQQLGIETLKPAELEAMKLAEHHSNNTGEKVLSV